MSPSMCLAPVRSVRQWRCRVVSLLAVTIVGSGLTAPVSSAQEPVVPASQRSDVAQATDSETLARVIAVKIQDVPLESAIQTVAHVARVYVSFSPSVLPTTRVTLVADRISVGDALRALLRGSGVSPVALAPGRVTLEAVTEPASGASRSVRQAAGDSGVITGVIRDSLTGAAVPYVSVRVDETGQTVRAGGDGTYALKGLPAGAYHLTARRVGFVAKTRVVNVEDGKIAKLDFVLNQPPTKLDEVVTTALGDQHRYEVGNDIATINVDSLTPTLPATSMTDVIESRAPGVQVIESGGLAGSGQAIRIRGQSSLILQGDPIIYVDGIRQDNTAGGTLGGSVFGNGVPSPNRLNDIDFSQVETIDILKGPSASTEYGTDAANGVIVITTKRGTAGKTQWNASAEQNGSSNPTAFPNYYYSWGHLTDGSHAATRCPQLPIQGGRQAPNGPPYNTGAAFGTCIVDSVTSFNPLNNPETSVYGTGQRQKYDLSVGGGTETVRYYVAGGLSNELGDVRLPPVFRSQALANGIPSSEMSPNSLDQRQVRATMTMRLGSTADLSVTSAYLSTHNSMPAAGLADVTPGYPALDDSAHNYGYWDGQASDARSLSPIFLLGQNQQQQTDRVTGGMTATWRPLAWFTAHATVGIDHGSQSMQEHILPQVAVFRSGDSASTAGLEQIQTENDIYSADVRASAVASPFHWLRLTTSLGIQYADTRTSGLDVSGNATVTQPTLNGNGSVAVSQLSNQYATLGGYVEEGFGLFNALYWALALRLDAGSGFGQAIRDAAYPKFDLSYAVLKSDPTSLRFRVALGAAGRQPNDGANRQLYDITQLGYLPGGNVSTGLLLGPGNPNLKPERSMEYEGGVDLGLWSQRLTFGVTGYYKRTTDALLDQTLGFDLGDWSYEENIGTVENTGLEASLSAVVIQSRALSWGVSFSGTINHDKLTHVDPGFVQPVLGPASVQRQALGYPLYGYWARAYHYAAPNANGVLLPSNLTIDDSASYIGSSIPTREGTVATHVALLHNVLTIGGSFSYAGGFKVYNYNSLNADFNSNSLVTNETHAPRWEQARALAAQVTPAGYIEDGTYVRFRELSLTYAVPVRWARFLHAQNLSITGAVRNLALWTRFTGGDPEVSNPGVGPAPIGSGASSAVNNDVRQSGTGAVPLARYWFVRLNLGW